MDILFLMTCTTCLYIPVAPLSGGNGLPKKLQLKKMKLPPLVKAFEHALNGIRHFMIHDRNGKIHIAAGILVIVAGIYCKVAINEWAILLLCMALVISFEMINHALEKICDVVHEDTHPFIKTAKDVAAGAVLWSAVISAVIGLLIFIPKIIAAV